MTTLRRRALFWIPRILAMLYVVFLSMFALDVFSEEHGFWRILVALSIHLIPSFVLIAVLTSAGDGSGFAPHFMLPLAWCMSHRYWSVPSHQR